MPSILITDDDVSFRETLRGVLEPYGYHTLEAGDGAEALEIVRARPVHVLLLDMHMPRLTGLETIRLVRQMQFELPCILISAEADQSVVDQALSWRAVQFLRKPISRQATLQAVLSALAKSA